VAQPICSLEFITTKANIIYIYNVDFEERARRRQSNNFRTENYETDDTDQSPRIFKFKEFTNGVEQKHKYTNRNHQEKFTKRNETVYIGKRVH